jgi:serine/threonine protein kinase
VLKTISTSELRYKEKTYKGGSEGCIYNILDPSKIYKELDTQTSIKVRDNKKQKIILLDEIKEVADVIPKFDFLVNDDLNKYLVGYVMEKCNGITLDLACFNFYENLIILRKIKNYLEIFKKNNIQYIDFKGDNIIVDETNFETRILDIDNVGIDKYDLDLIPDEFKRYIKNGGKINFNGSLFAFNKMAYDILKLDSDKDYEVDKNINKFRLSFEAYKPNSHADSDYIVDYIEKEKIKNS